MNINDYEKKYYPIYQAFGETIRFILEKALLSPQRVPLPQSIQCRAKGIKSLRRRLAEAGNLDTHTLEVDRRDLAGVRLIFYTNNDVERFLTSSLILDNFQIEEDSTKFHHPTSENQEARYRAVHYTVRLSEDRIRLPEYARFDGLRCEIQVQTILNHAWSETSHDILYKNRLGDGYGEKAIKGIERRFERIMDKYLIPAGFEIQKAQQEYERVLKGKELFERDIANLLDNAKNNNERYEILSGLRDYAIPNYDDLPTAYDGLKGPLLRAVKAARSTEPVPIETTYGKIEGFKSDAITRLVVEIVQALRYADVIETLQLLINIYRDEPSGKIRDQIVKVVKILSEYNIDTYNQVGPRLQIALIDKIASLSDAEVDSIRPIALTVWSEVIQSDITGAKWKADSVTFSTGAVPVSDQLKEVRDKAIKALFAAFDRSTNDSHKRAVLSALDSATRTPNQVQYSNDLLATTIKDATRIVDFMTERSKTMSYELLQHLEHKFLYDYFRAEKLAEDTENRFNCKTEAAALVAAIINFRDRINADNRFVRYKILVGFESVYPSHWSEKKLNHQETEEYRREEADRWIDEINATNENELFDLISCCAETKSNDMATFPTFSYFIEKLAELKPGIAGKFLEKASVDLRKFLSSFLNGLALSDQPKIYELTLENELKSARDLGRVARHLRYSNVEKPNLAARLLKRAIDNIDADAVIDCLLFALENYGTEKIADVDTFLRDTLTFLNNRRDSRWVSNAWFLGKATKCYQELNPERTAQVLENLCYLPHVDYQSESILVQLAKRYPEKVLDYFGTRIARETAGENQERYEAVPFRFHELDQELSKDPILAITKGLSWFVENSKLFRYLGGRLLSNAFPNCTVEFAAALAELVKSGSDKEAEFALAILQNYNGETSAYVVLKEIVSRFIEDARKMSDVRICIDSTGVVSGYFGRVEALRSKKVSMKEWLEDKRPKVRAFAERHIAELDLMIASEQSRAETDREMRKRNYVEDDELLDDINDEGETVG